MLKKRKKKEKESKVLPPVLKVFMHKPSRFVKNHKMSIWVEIWNLGGDAVLYTNGIINGRDMGRGMYRMPMGSHVNLGFLYGIGPRLDDDWLGTFDKVYYQAEFRLENGAGSTQGNETHEIPVVSDPYEGVQVLPNMEAG